MLGQWPDVEVKCLLIYSNIENALTVVRGRGKMSSYILKHRKCFDSGQRKSQVSSYILKHH